MSNLTAHQSRPAAARAGVVLDAGVLQTGLALLPQSPHGVVADVFLLRQLDLLLLSRTHRLLQGDRRRVLETTILKFETFHRRRLLELLR